MHYYICKYNDFFRGKKTKLTKAKVLFDSGCSSTIASKHLCKKLCLKNDSTSKWMTQAGEFTTTKKWATKFVLPEFTVNKIIDWNVHVFENKNPMYDLIIGRDLLHELGIDLLFSEGIMKWDTVIVPMKPKSFLSNSNLEKIEKECYEANDKD